MFHWLTNALGSSPWTYAIVLAIVASDGVLMVGAADLCRRLVLDRSRRRAPKRTWSLGG